MVSGGYFTHYCDAVLCEALIGLFKDRVKTVVDIGCGNGEYVRKFIEAGIDCIGFDGSPLTPNISGGLCQVRDFSQPTDIGVYDLAYSLEVGEHIPAGYEQIFIDNVVKASNKYIVLSWAVEGQPGLGHINCRNNDYVIGEMQKLNCTYNKEDSEYLRSHSTFPWFANTVMVFIKN